MIIEKIATGKTTDEAIANARAMLNAPEKFQPDVKTEILELPRKKILGLFGGAPAKVRAYYDDGVKEKPVKKDNKKKQANKKQTPAKQQPKQQQSKAKKQPAAEAKAVVKTEKKDYPKSVDLEYAKAYLLDIVKGLDINDASVDASYSEGVVTLDLSCEDYGIVIGRRGDTLDSIQYLLSLAMKKHTNTLI